MTARLATARRPFDPHSDVLDDPASGLLVLPGDASHDFGYAEWDEDWPAMWRVVLTALAEGARPVWISDPDDDDGRQLVLPLTVELVPRPDNDYNDEAIALAGPPSMGGSVLDRHLGYMNETHLHYQGDAIRDLAEHTGRPVGAHAWVELWDFEAVSDARYDAGQSGDRARWAPSSHWIADDVEEGVEAELSEEPDLEADLDEDSRFTAAELRRFGYRIGGLRYTLAFAPGTSRAVDAYVTAHPQRQGPGLDARRDWHQRFVDAAARALARRSATGAWGRLTERQAAADVRQAAALGNLQAWEQWRRQDSAYGRLHARTVVTFGRRDVLVLDDAGVQVGKLDGDVLTLVDERCRAAAVTAIAEHASPGTVRDLDLSGLGEYPDAVLIRSGPGWVVVGVAEGREARGSEPLGWVEPEGGLAHVLAPAHQRPVGVLLARHGVNVSRVALSGPTSAPDWVWLDPDARRVPVTSARARLALRAEHAALVPPEVATALPLRFTSEVRSQDLPGLADSGLLRDWYQPAPRSRLLSAQCRLCGSEALAPADAATYCGACINLASRGLLVDTGCDGPWTQATVWALRTLAEKEFSGPPSLAQLARVPGPGVPADLAVLCRMLVPRMARLPVRYQRKPLSFTEWLAAAGLLDEGLSTPRGTRSVASDGHACRSLLERHVDDFMAHHGIEHEVEPSWPAHPRWNTTGMRADWRLGDGTMVEAFGLEGHGAYDAKVERKRALAHELGVRLVEVRTEDLGRLRETFADWL